MLPVSFSPDDEPRARLAAIVASSDDAIISKDLRGIIQTWNRGAERIFGYTADEVIGRSITIIIPEERLGEETEVLRRICAGESVDHFETVRRGKDGRFIDISLTVSPIADQSGRIVGASKIARDITEQMRLKREAEEASRLKDEFLATLSHELRTPLNAVLGYAMLLSEGSLAPDQQNKATVVIRRNAEALARLVDDLLDASRIVTGKMHLQLGPCDLGALVREALEVVSQAIQGKSLRLEVSIAETEPVIGDCDRLRQVFWNLLANAIKFTPLGGSVTVGVDRVGAFVRVVVRDTGIGIPAQAIPYVFQRFWQVESTATREHGGLGLGLALSRHLVELHGGTIAVESAGTGKGAEFRIELPVQRDLGKKTPGASRLVAQPSGDGEHETGGGDATDVRAQPATS
jgi:PAS domain S-box-containing protein